MRTHCQILFTDGDVSILTYKHFDGYPEGAIPLLCEFWHWYPRTENLEYLTATWFYFCKRQYEERSKELDLYDDPMKTNELNTNHPVALSYGICAEDEMHGDIEHFYEVNIKDERVTHYTPEEVWFEDVDSPAEIVGQEPEETYSLSLDDTGIKFSTHSSQATSITDGGQIGKDDLDGRCVNCGSTEGINWLVQSGTPAGMYLGLSNGETTELCDACIGEVAEWIADEDENASNESTQGGDNGR